MRRYGAGRLHGLRPRRFGCASSYSRSRRKADLSTGKGCLDEYPFKGLTDRAAALPSAERGHVVDGPPREGAGRSAGKALNMIGDAV